MRHFLILPIILLPFVAYAGDVDSRIDEISARLGLPASPTMDTPQPSTNGQEVATPANSESIDPLMPVVQEQALSAPQKKRRWYADFRRRDIDYLGQWVDVFVGEGYATPVTFPKPVRTIKIIKPDEIGFASNFVKGLTTYNIIPKADQVNTQMIVKAMDGTQYLLLIKDGNTYEAHGRIDAGGVRLIERRDPPKEGVDLDALSSWEKYGAGNLATRKRITRLLVAMHKKEKVSGYTVLNFKGKVVASDPIVQMHLVRVWHKPSAKHPMDGIEYWMYNKSDSPIAVIPQYLKRMFSLDGDFAISYQKDTILPHDYMPIYVIQRMNEGRKLLEEVPADLDLMLEDVRAKVNARQLNKTYKRKRIRQH